MSEAVITYRGVVYPWQCDHMGHMNVMWYVGKFDEATWQVFSAMGLTQAYLRENDCGMAAVDQRIEYKRELMAGDTITVRSTIQEMKDKAVVFRHEMRREDGVLAAATTLTAVHIDTKLRKARAFPLEIRTKAQLLVSAEQ